MSLLDPNIQVIIGKEKKRSWKDHLRGFDPEIGLQDEDGNDIGNFYFEKDGAHGANLWDVDGNELLRILPEGLSSNDLGVWDPEGNRLFRLKTGLTQLYMEDLDGEKFLESKKIRSALSLFLLDKTKKEVAELKLKRWNRDFKLIIKEPNFAKLPILGFSLSYFVWFKRIIKRYGSYVGS